MKSLLRKVLRNKPSAELTPFQLGQEWGRGLKTSDDPPSPPREFNNPLRDFFEQRTQGAGIWKWMHYFDAYHRHLQKFREKSPVVVEIGVYSGGSLEMWHDYFGPTSEIHGVDIVAACRVYERDGVKIHIGDQENSNFWKDLIESKLLPRPDIVIDDGGHTYPQQRVTFETLLPLMNPGGVYICEDVHGAENLFYKYMTGAVSSLNAMEAMTESEDNPDRRYVVQANAIQRMISSVHLYPFMVVLERAQYDHSELLAPKRGTEWEPHLT